MRASPGPQRMVPSPSVRYATTLRSTRVLGLCAPPAKRQTPCSARQALSSGPVTRPPIPCVPPARRGIFFAPAAPRSTIALGDAVSGTTNRRRALRSPTGCVRSALPIPSVPLEMSQQQSIAPCVLLRTTSQRHARIARTDSVGLVPWGTSSAMDP